MILERGDRAFYSATSYELNNLTLKNQRNQHRGKITFRADAKQDQDDFELTVGLAQFVDFGEPMVETVITVK